MFVKWLDVKICSGKTFCYPSLAFSLLLIFFQNYQRSGHFPLSKSIISSTSPPLIFFQNYQLKNAEPRPFSLLENRHFSSSRPHLPPSFPPVPPSPARPPSASDFPKFFKGSGTFSTVNVTATRGARTNIDRLQGRHWREAHLPPILLY